MWSTLGGLITVSLLALWMSRRPSIARKLLTKWAHENSYVLLEARQLWAVPLVRGNGIVFEISVMDSRGTLRHGRAYVGDRFWGLAEDRVSIEWHDRSSAS